MTTQPVLAYLTTAICFAASSSAQQPPTPTPTPTVSHIPQSPSEKPIQLHFVWMDYYRLLPFGFEPMTKEVDSIFGPLGIEITWERGRHRRAPGLLDITVILRASSPPGWNLGEHAMGTVVKTDTSRQVVYLFYNNVLRTLDITRRVGEPPTATQTGRLARALARVVAHEVVHSFAPDLPHTSTGLMRRRMTYRAFKVKRLEWTEGCAAAFLDGLYTAAEGVRLTHEVASNNRCR